MFHQKVEDFNRKIVQNAALKKEEYWLSSKRWMSLNCGFGRFLNVSGAGAKSIPVPVQRVRTPPPQSIPRSASAGGSAELGVVLGRPSSLSRPKCQGSGG